MGVMNKFLNIMRLDDGYEDDFDDDDFEEEKPVRKSVPKRESRTSRDEDYDEPVQRQEKIRPVKSQKVIPVRSISNKSEICVIKPTNVEDGREISDTLLSGKAVILNLEGLQVSIAQRIIDFTSGACYSINGNLQKITTYIFLATPEIYELSGDIQDILSNASSSGFDMNSHRKDY